MNCYNVIILFRVVAVNSLYTIQSDICGWTSVRGKRLTNQDFADGLPRTPVWQISRLRRKTRVIMFVIYLTTL
jgi:hypothetical protein